MEMVYDYQEGRNEAKSRLPLDIEKLLELGVVYVTPAIDGDPDSPTYKEWLDEPYSHLITLYNLVHSKLDTESCHSKGGCNSMERQVLGKSL